MTGKHPKNHASRKSGGRRRSLFWPGLGIGALALAFAAFRIYARYGSADPTQAETIIHGMLLFLGGIVALAFIVVLLVKAVRRLTGRPASILDRIDAAVLAEDREEDR